MDTNVLEFVDHLHEHFLSQCRVQRLWATYNVFTQTDTTGVGADGNAEPKESSETTGGHIC
jgi:hypothetical protein